ncbi:MAG: tRNA uridine-5-carboxymethylaminomethyl(34) synthesis GTPase MnmE [Clostridiales bacterium]|nr:tRNA uridine-5-carboxymethylaminomethyl(34) synthesis GTPase MnmE [Clostridiales bacterium]
MMENTIVAISTAMGNGGIGIVRMSGEKSFEILDKIFRPKNNDGIINGYQIKYGNIIDPKNEESVDEVLVSYFVAPKSYTTENMCEINTHGGMVVEKRILVLCLENGAEIAGPGEFTKRAFLNGRIDLSQAEAIIDLINSKTVREAKESINQLEGHLSSKIENIRQKMLNLMIAIDVNIDYPEYDEEEVTKNRSLGELRIISEELIKLENSFNSGKILRDGVKTVILGKTNAGKSSLLNRILKEDRAIVSNIEGTTRDTIEEFVDVEGIPLKLIDTAGIRNSSNEIEQIGIQKSKKLADSADLIIAIFDITKNLTEDDQELLEIIKDKECIILLNKIDVLSENIELEKCLKSINKNILKISAMEDIGIQQLFDKIVEIYSFNNDSLSNDVLISNERHKNLIQKARMEIDEAINAAENDMYIDIISIYITNAMNYLAEITGNNVTDDVINEIFKKFCLGK